MNRYTISALAMFSLLSLSACGGPSGGAEGGRDFVRAVGSSTIYPFATAVAEHTAKSEIKSPIVESTGTGSGIKLFCGGVGTSFPDIANASRRMKATEYQLCSKNGVNEIIEVQVGIDGIAFAEALAGPNMKLTTETVYKALAKNPFGKPNTAKKWSDVDPSLPAIPILVYGPPTTSGTRDALAELILEKGCKTDLKMKALKETDEDSYKRICTQVREDGAYVEGGENDNLLVQKIAQNPKAIGVFGYSFLEENGDKLKGVPMSGVAPTYQTISDFSYPGARPLYIYAKKAHLGPIRGLKEYLAEWPKAWGPDGYLKRKGMVIAPDDVRARNAEVIANMTLLNASELK